MIIDTHCHFDMMPNPEAYISAKEKAGEEKLACRLFPKLD